MCQIKRAGTRIFSAYRLFGAYAYTLIILLLYVGVNIAKNNDLNESLSGKVGGFTDGDYAAVTGLVEQAAAPGISNSRGYPIGDGNTYYVDGTFGLYKNYNASTGILTAYNYCNAGIKNHDGWTGTKKQTNSSVRAYLVI